jgi:purine-nucleoside phosphorylase
MAMVVPSACNDAQVGDIAKVVLMPGDPLRAKTLAENYLENPVCFNTIRNMYGYTGTYRGKKISVMGSGMGIPSACLYEYELFTWYGVEAVIRIGSAGGVSEDVKCRDLVIAMSAATNSNYSDQYRFPGILPPTADYEMLKTADRIAEKKGVTTKVGTVFTSDMFYSAIPNAYELYRAENMLAVEMETAGIYWTANHAGKKALSLLSISDHVFTGEALSAQDRQDSFRDMMEIALDTAWEFTD